MYALVAAFLTICSLLLSANGASWTKDEFKNYDGSTYAVTGPTVLKQGPDLRYYIGGKGQILALTVDKEYIVTASCVSAGIEEDRFVLGMTFLPQYFKADDVIFFASTSIIRFAGGASAIPDPNTYAWANGRVDVMRTNVGDSCLSRVGSIVTGLPVANSEHGVNGLAINFDGNLLISNGGSTNAGIAEAGDPAGGYPETPLSGAVLEAQFLKEGYVGDVLYSLPDGRSTDIINSPGIQYFATGTRNAFGIEVHSSAGVFLVDNGPNAGYGKTSTGCETIDETNPDYQDKFIRLSRGGYYGHPNRNRGRYDPKQCVYEPLGFMGGNGLPELSMIESSTNGISEYSSGVQGGAFKHAMIFARFGFDAMGSSFAFTLDAGGNAITGREEIFEDDGGLDVIMDKRANLVATEYIGGRIKVFRAEMSEEFTSSPVAIVSVLPDRGPPAGFNNVLVSAKVPETTQSIEILFGDQPAPIIGWPDSGTFLCTVPTGRPLQHVDVTIIADGVASTRSGNGDYRYMEESSNAQLPEWILSMNSTAI